MCESVFGCWFLLLEFCVLLCFCMFFFFFLGNHLNVGFDL